MDREEIRNRIFNYLKQQLSFGDDPSRRLKIQMGDIGALFRKETESLLACKQDDLLSVAREIVHELMNNGALYPGQHGQVQGSDFFPWLTITEYGKELLMSEDWLPYDPEGYLKELKNKVPKIDGVTLAYIGESVEAFRGKY